MLIAACLIMMSWTIQIPLWVSIVTTVSCGLHIIAKLIKLGIDCKS